MLSDRFAVAALALTAAVTLFPHRSARGENWPQWRGPRGDGVSGETGLPTRWSATTNLAWKSALPGLGTSTPIVWDDLVFVTAQLGQGPLDTRGAEFEETRAAREYSTDEPSVWFVLEAFHRTDGRRVWEHRFEAARPKEELPSVHPKHNLASPSVVTDGALVYAWVGTGQLIALEMSGELVWQKDLGSLYAPFDVLWGHGSSPALYHDLVILQCDHPPGAYLVALDKRTGEERWKVDRGPGLRSYSTPFLVESDGPPELVVNSSHRLESFDPRTGELLWFVGEAVTLAIPMPVYSDGILYASRGYASGPFFAVRLGGRGDVRETHLRWRVPTRAPYISSLAWHDGLLYMANERGVASVVEAETGDTLWRQRLGGAFSASPVIGDSKVYLLNELGETFVLAPGRTPKILAKNELEERTLASPAISGGLLFLRSDEHLYAIGGEHATEVASPPE